MKKNKKEKRNSIHEQMIHNVNWDKKEWDLLEKAVNEINKPLSKETGSK